MTYVGLVTASIYGEEVTQDKGSRILKATRIIRLAKMLRVARLKRIIGRHASLVEFTAYVNSLFTFIAILYVAHLGMFSVPVPVSASLCLCLSLSRPSLSYTSRT